MRNARRQRTGNAIRRDRGDDDAGEETPIHGVRRKRRRQKGQGSEYGTRGDKPKPRQDKPDDGRARIFRMGTSSQLSNWSTIRKSTSFSAELVPRVQRPSSRFEESRRALECRSYRFHVRVDRCRKSNGIGFREFATSGMISRGARNARASAASLARNFASRRRRRGSRAGIIGGSATRNSGTG